MELLFLSEPAFWVIIALASELIALSPLKENSVIQSIQTLLNKLKPSEEPERNDQNMNLKNFKGKPSKRDTQTPHDKNYYPTDNPKHIQNTALKPNSKKKRRRNTNVSTGSSSLMINRSNSVSGNALNI